MPTKSMDTFMKTLSCKLNINLSVMKGILDNIEDVDNLSKLKIEELKDKCRNHHLIVGGTKASLIQRLLEKHVEVFIQNLSEKLNIQASTIKEVWNSLKEDDENLSNLSLEKLKEMCIEHNLPTDGKSKTIMISRIQDYRSKLVLNKLKNQTIIFTKNAFDNYEHVQSHLVAEPNTKIVCGVQNDNGSIDLLKEKDIEFCKENNLQWNENSVAPVIKFETSINDYESDIDVSDEE